MSVAQFPARIYLHKWLDTGFDWQGQVELDFFKRLATETVAPPQANKNTANVKDIKQTLQLRCHINRDGHFIWLTLTVLGEVWQTCQRCLQPVVMALSVDSHIALLTDITQVDSLPEDADYVLLQEVMQPKVSLPTHAKSLDRAGAEHYLLHQAFALADVVEDEILLKLPLSAKHTDCDMATTQVGKVAEQPKENPFAALAQLKGKL